VSSLAGRTLFITGGSRGIGKAIALRAARDGANVVIAAKTVEPHRKLPGTIFDAAHDVERAGGKALPVQVDIRDEAQVASAVARAADHFGGIDVLVNNASAISLTGTLDTPVRRFDLMMAVNARGTFVCSQACLPWLRRSRNPHILVIAPPPDPRPEWFAPHPAYSLAKFGMSLLALGMAGEFRAEGIAVNCLWPRTLIATSALDVIDVGTSRDARKPEIMADAAHVILCSDSRQVTGRFFIDEAVLRDAGTVDFDAYAVDPGRAPRIDLFVPDGEATT
jgi:citronellol/citronellal dehydrogenase